MMRERKEQFCGDSKLVVVPTIRATPFRDFRDTIASAINNLPRVMAIGTRPSTEAEGY